MRKPILLFIYFLLYFMLHDSFIYAQLKEDTLLVKENSMVLKKGNKIPEKDSTVVKKKFIPRIATIRSAILPGWGQVYNKKYWKIPIIYGALGTTGYIFFFNLKTYKMLREAVISRYDTSANPPPIDPSLVNLSTAALVQYRNEYRQNIDYSVLFFLIFWGLNVVDATVDAHLKGFDVSPDVSMKIRPGLNSMNNGPGISFIFSFKEKHSKISMPLP